MEYIVLDLEWNQSNTGKEDGKRSRFGIDRQTEL